MKLTEASILVADDEPALREIFGKWLQALGCRHVSVAGDGAEALEILATRHFDLLVTDVRMPVVDGVTLVRRLRESKTPIPSIIFVSGFADVEQKEMYGLGVEAFLSKPIRMEELIAVMEKALAERCDLWLTPMETEPRQTMVVQAEEMGVGAGKRDIQLGRGGFSAPFPGHLSPGKVAFQCSSAATGRVLEGQGYVRWRCLTEGVVGVEYFYVHSACRDWLLEEMARHPPLSYIPTC